MRPLGLVLLVLAAGCDAGGASTPAAAESARPAAPRPGDVRTDEHGAMVFIPGGTFAMGSDEGMPHESPVHPVTLAAFWMDRTEVTVGEYRRFVMATGHRTEAEKTGWSAVFDVATREWTRVDGARWSHPEGPAHPATEDEPVTQLAWSDAAAYARWANKRLPTEAEWERAARGGLEGKTYAWGDELRPAGKVVANWWQGSFPARNTLEDGFLGRAPVARFPANGYGLYDVAGNVWEWCADWYDARYYDASPSKNPSGPASGAERVMRGGSFLCAENFCVNYRVAGRGHAPPDSGANHVGFRCARD